MKYIKLFEEVVNEAQYKPIILIGPQGSGKSTTAQALAKDLGIRLIETDIAMIDKDYEEACKSEPGVEVEITRGPGGGVNYSSNKAYEFCVVSKILDKANGPFVLDVGGSHAHWKEPFAAKIKEMFGSTPNLFLFGVNGTEEEEYSFLKNRRAGRGEKINLEQEDKFKKTISDLRSFWKSAKPISIVDEKGTAKSTTDLVKEIKNQIA